jgi:hypothetical protein
MMLLFFLLYSAQNIQMSFDKVTVLKWVESNAVSNKNGKIIGFKESPALTKNEPHLVHSYCAVAILKLLNIPESNNIIEVLRSNYVDILEWIKSL